MIKNIEYINIRWHDEHSLSHHRNDEATKACHGFISRKINKKEQRWQLKAVQCCLKEQICFTEYTTLLKTEKSWTVKKNTKQVNTEAKNLERLLWSDRKHTVNERRTLSSNICTLYFELRWWDVSTLSVKLVSIQYSIVTSPQQLNLLEIYINVRRVFKK